ncbi:DEAD/DEAH box helicase family protein [Planctellipticum variicoloris]|uniref:DEAD/DEAH box helicase family protein n=1 Tax=Planctellipticum variicoloris TaxID=3064265 RepID=UPI003013A294|nr:DEAD/DEAH box helicase family protein [Planctomycetaceae bacterium SH412]
MPSNFDFLQPHWASLHDDASQAEGNVYVSPRTAVFYARRTLERAVQWLYAHDGGLSKPYQENLAALIHEPTFREILPATQFQHARLIVKLGNQAVHSDTPINATDALHLTRMLHAFLGWVARIYGKPQPTVPAFDDGLLTRPQAPAPDRSADQIRQLLDQLTQKDAELAAKAARLAETDAEIARLKQEIAAQRAAREQVVPVDEVSEAATRDLFIDVLLREAGWDPHGPQVHEYPVTGMPTGTGQGFVDYVLWGQDGRPLAVVEAKRTRVDPQNGKRQAELYADCLEQAFGQRPVIYYTNGYETWCWDDASYPPRSVQGFRTRDELQLLIHRRDSRQGIVTASANRDIADRYYQQEAIRRVCETYDRDRQRHALLVMATGTGKTRLSIAAVELLMKHNWVRRVLFLADRNALLTQARRAFTKFLPNTASVDITQAKERDDSRIVFSTYPTMMNAIDDERRDGVNRFGVGHFDLVIIDEAHRSVYQKYRAIFEYFDALLLGLTATPRSEVDRDTYGLFHLEQNVPTHAYELDQAVADGYLVPPQPIAVPTKFSRQGVKYADLTDDEKKEYEVKFFDEETGAVPDEIDASALNRWLFNADTVDKVLAYVMGHGQHIEGGDKLGKTILFAANHNHAQFVVDRFDANYPHLKGKFCSLIDNQVKFAQSLIDDFSLPAKPPQIAVSVDMLDTGIDVPECVNLVFFKRVRSRTKFWQMIGRGTRLCPDLFGPGLDKKSFAVLDFCENFEFFGKNPDGVEGSVQESVKTKIFRRRVSLLDLLRSERHGDEPHRKLRTEIADHLHREVSQVPLDSFVVRPHRREIEKFSKREAWDQLSPGELVDIHQHLANLPTPDDGDEFARRFDLLLLNLQLGILEASPHVPRWQNQVHGIAAGLEEKEAIPAVRQHLALIQELQTEEYWQHITLPMLEDVRRNLRALVQFLDREGKRDNVYTDFEDELGDAKEIEGLIQPDSRLGNYRLKVERFVRQHQDHPTIDRLRRNQPISTTDLQALEAILFAENGPGGRDQFEQTYGTDMPLGKLIREIVGLDANAAKEAFAQFLAAGTLTGDQITFINQIIDHLVHNGLMDPKALFEPPFTDFHDQGISGVLPHLAPQIVQVIRAINGNALATGGRAI